MLSENYPLTSFAQEFSALRDRDRYHPDMDADSVIKRYLPEDMQQLMLGMSEITASFYGTLLKHAVDLQGNNMADALSCSLINTLGKNRAYKILERYPSLQRDAGTVIEMIISAIFTANPEFSFEIDKYTAAEVIFSLRGTDRYHRITEQLTITPLLEWPVVLPFFEGICEVAAPGYKVMTLEATVDEKSQCKYVFRIYQEATVSAPELQTGIQPPFFQLPTAVLTTSGKFLKADLGAARNFQGGQFAELIRQCLSAEAWNACRLYPSGEGQYMLGGKFSCMRTGSFSADTQLKAVIETQQISKRRRKCIIRVVDDTGIMIYLLFFDYYMWEETAFKNRFDFLQSKGEPWSEEPDVQPVINRMSFENAWHYTSRISPVKEIHCLGHFDGYPCVPVLILFRLLYMEAEKWMNEVPGLRPETRMVVDGINIHPVRIMPTGEPFNLTTTVHQLSKDIFKFVHFITQGDDAGIIFCSITFDITLEG